MTLSHVTTVIALMTSGISACCGDDNAALPNRKQLPASSSSQGPARPVSQVAEVYSLWPFDAHEAARRRDATARSLGVPKELVLDLGDKVTMKLVLIPAGKFMMGSDKAEARYVEGEAPRHEVTITRPFYMGIHEVTQRQYHAIMWMRRMNDEFYTGASLPIEQVSWERAMDFCDKLSARTGKKVSLPTEAQWEYACRAGTETLYNTGETISRDEANVSPEGYFWPLLPVGSFKPNAFGLHDMHGNSSEWCADLYDEGYYKRSEKVDPSGPTTVKDLRHVVRGGSRGFVSATCRSACRYLSKNTCDSGFRVVAALDGKRGVVNPVEEAKRLLAAVEVLHEWDFRARKRIPVQLASLGPVAKPAILTALKDPNPRVRTCVSLALSYIPDVSDIPLLLTPVSGEGGRVALKMLGARAVKPLLDTLRKSGAAGRDDAARILYEIDPVAAADPVLELGKNDGDKAIRYLALEAAVSHGDKRAVGPLLAAVAEDIAHARPDEENRHSDWCSALETAFVYGGKRGADLFLTAMEAGKITVWEFPGGGPRDARLVPYLVKGLDDKKDTCLADRSRWLLRSYQNDPRAVAALTAHGWEKDKDRSLKDDSFESLVQKLGGPDESTADDAARALGKRREKRAVKPLLEFVVSGRGWGRHSALYALGEIGDSSAAGQLIKFLAAEPAGNNSNWDLRRPAIEALGRLRAKDAIEPLVVLASDPDSYGPGEAVEALGRIGGERALAAVETVFRTSSDILLRERAWRVLHKDPHGDSSETDDW